MIDALIQEMHRAIDKQELSPSSVQRSEPPTPIPIIRRSACGVRNLLWRGPRAGIESIDRDDSRRMRVTAIIH